VVEARGDEDGKRGVRNGEVGWKGRLRGGIDRNGKFLFHALKG